MNKLKVLCLFLAFSISAYAVKGKQVVYAGGTAPGIIAGSVGTLNTTSDVALIFGSSAGTLQIPYGNIESFEYSREVARHLGVLPAIAVGLVKMRWHRHFFRISYRDQKGTIQVAVFEVSKQMPRTLRAVLQARVPRNPGGNSPGCNTQAAKPRSGGSQAP
jgi:hypothetical protein